MSGTWRPVAHAPEVRVLGTQPALMTLHFLRNALRRRRLLCVNACLLGILLGLGWGLHSQSTSTASTTILLAHNPSEDPATAMATDVSLLDSRAVARTVIESLDLDMTSEQLQASVTAVPLTAQLLELQVAAPSRQEAQRRTEALADAFLDFRASQLMRQSEAVIEGYQERVDSLEQEYAALTSQYSALITGGSEQQTAAADLLSERSRVADQTSLLQQRIEDTSLDAEAVVAASNVVDPAHVEAPSVVRAWGLPLVSGGVAGLGLGVGWVLMTALTSDRLRRRDEVAMATGSPVVLSLGRLRRPWWQPWDHRARRRDLANVVRQLSPLIDGAERPSRLALVAVDEVGDVARAAWVMARWCAARAIEAQGVDLSRNGDLKALTSSRPGRTKGKPRRPFEVFRPREVFAKAPRRASVSAPFLARRRATRPRTSTAQVTLVLAEVDPGVGVDSLASWARDAVLFVTTGRSSAEELRTISDLFLAAGIRLHATVLLRADRTDPSSGLLSGTSPGAADDRQEAR